MKLPIGKGSTALSERFRLLMSRVSSQAMILTAGELHGMTLSSVCSLSVLPNPLLQFSLNLPSFTSRYLHDFQFLAIHVLPPTANSAHLSRIFAKGIKQGKKLAVTKEEQKDGEIFHEMTTPFKDLKPEEYTFYHIDGVKIPILKDVETVLICQTYKNFVVDNHEIWVVKVKEILQNDFEKSGGLLYYNRAFHKIGKSI